MKKQNIFQIALLAVALFMGSAAMAQSKIYYVTPNGAAVEDGWIGTMTLTNALDKAVAGDQIWVQGFETITDYSQIYITPTIDGFTLKSGVQLYGGFKGDETTLDARETLGKPYQLRYRTVLSGDIDMNDIIDNTNLIFPANTTRTDNATHVLSINMTPTSSSSNNNTYPTVVNGFSIGGGQADGANEYGGGIYIHGDNTNGGIFRIERCFFVNNYATQGGAIYVAAEVQNRNNNESLINQCVVYNNAAGERAAVVNAGGGIYLAGQATVVNSSIFNNENGGLRLSTGSKVINSTVARNSGAGIDMIETVTDFSVFNVSNTIIWGNTLLSAQYQPQFKNSAYHEVTVTNTDAGTDNNHNVYVTKENRGDKDAPMFDAPSVKTSFDRDFNWRQMAYPLWSWNVLEGSVMHDKGYGNAYQASTYGNQDMAGNPRVDGVIDIGAYEFQKIPTSRIRYVKKGGTGDGSSWDNASGDLQKMIDELANNNPQKLAGEVWVAAGTYVPQSQLISGTAYSASFRMRDGISVYGGFAGTETTKQDRQKGTMPWDYTNVTILEGAYYDHANLQWNNNKWTLTSDSRHVVWFAPMANEGAFGRVTILDGVTIQGGYAQGGTGLDDFKTDRGAGVYMDGANAYLTNCIVKENYATGNGGGVYLKDGRVETSFIYNNNADADGGAVYVDNRGLVLRSMLANNSAHNGAGAYLHNEEETLNDHPEYLILSTCVVSNNTMSGNGAVYCDKGGVLMQNTITNNNCVTATDATDSNASQTGGIYVDEYALVVNSVIWNNQMGKTGGTNIPMYARNPSASKVRFLYNAISGTNNAVWNYTLQEQTLSLVDDNAGATDDGSSIGPRFTEPTTDMDFKLATDYGVQEDWKDDIISYYWKPISGSNLWGRGMALGQLPEEVVLTPEMDIEGNLFAQKPAVGAFMVTATPIQHETTDDALTVYMDVECTEPGHTGYSWATAYRSLNDAISYLAGLDATTVGNRRLIVRVLEGDLWPRYAFTNNDPKTATISVPVTQSGKAIEIYGGYYRDNINKTVLRDPLNHRSIINGNTEAKDIKEGLYHCITVQQKAQLVLDGFHVINGYAAGEATRQYGAGLLAHAGSTVTVRNCIFENNTAQEGAAIDAREATLTLQNCVVNNNTNTDAGKPVVNAQTLTMNHVTVVNNVGAAPADMGTSSFSAGNSSNNTQTLSTIGAEGAKNFANPTNKAGATLGFDTYLGGYSEFRPLTSSTNAAAVINKATTSTGLTTDIAGQVRNLGGAPDLGAYEAILPESGVIYVRGTDGNDNNNGSSWGTAFATLTKALKVAKSGDKIWVAAGIYTGTITGDPNNVNASTNIHKQPYAYEMKEGVNVYGGFPDSGTPGEDDRDPNTYKTYLQAQTNKPTYPQTSEYSSSWSNTGRVLVQRNHFTEETVWDGLVIRYGSLNTGYRYSITGNIMNLDTKVIGECGGAGVYMMGNSVLENCIIEDNIILADKKNIISNSGGIHTVAGGVFCRGGVIRNCQIINNSIRVYSQQQDSNGAAFSYGGGLYILNDETYTAAIFNSLISGNRAEALEWNNQKVSFHTMAIGAGACQISGNFYNNTIVSNTAKTGDANYSNIMCGGMFVYDSAEIYNCIIYNNKEEGGRNIGISAPENLNLQVLSVDIPAGSSGDKPNNDGYSIMKDRIHVYYSNVGYTDTSGNAHESSSLIHGDVTYASRHNVSGYPSFVDEQNGDYHLSTGSPAINSGTEAIPDGIGGYITIPDYDAEYTDRIKDCGIDMGAFESANEGNIGYETVTESDGTKKYIYYVTRNGDGLRSGASVDNAACAMKLQQILTAAGTAATTITDGQVYVRISGYANSTFVYHPNTLSNPNDPQSYTYVVPEGIIVEGGYSQDFKERKPLDYPTVLSAISEANASTVQTVRGYHAVTFGAWPGTKALTKPTIIDGLWLIDGSATSMAGTGNPNTRGGGAIVPSGAHVRNCVVMNCEAIEGGGLYLLPGATVSGTAVIECTATNGAGIYADNTDANKDSRAHILSCTIANNEASSTGGGLYMEDGAVMNVNTVIFDNRAGSDKNVSGVVSQQFKDAQLKTVFNISGQNSFYPFNNCFVETQEMPSDFENRMLESDKSLYFADDYYRLKDYSFLIKHGMKNGYQEALVTTFNVATQDMQNIDRIQTGNAAERLDAGAFAYEGGILPTDLFTRIFVSPTSNVTLPAGENMNNYLGRSFYTSFSTLEDALGYIRAMRSGDKATDATKFEILVAGGTYKPSYLRTTGAAVDHDQKLYSFVVPQGVSIYGGFSGTEKYSSGGIEEIPTTGGNITVDNTTSLTTILEKRAYSDFNQNGIYEPWELANQTILSGQINASSTAQNAYHVVFTDKGEATTVNPVVLDGLTVMYGQTDDELSVSSNEDEQGRGGGIYSNEVTYSISRCRLLNNTAVRGGAVFVRNADLNLSGCILAGNKTVKNTATGQTPTLTSRGGAAYVSGIDEVVNLRAVNTLWANNESAGEGGAIGTNYAEGISSSHDPLLYIMNNTFVRNKATTNPVIYAHNGKSHIVNTLIWGNQGDSYQNPTSLSAIYDVSHCASDVDYVGKFTLGNSDNNILLSPENMADKGPRFTNPSTEAGVDGNSASSLWNPVAISVLTDAGDGTEHTENQYPGETGHAANTKTGAYQDWFGDDGYLGKNGVTEAYITKDGGIYSRYSGPNNEENKPLCKPIDIGLYEYQYISNFSTMPAIYVDTTSQGDGSGNSWANATDDLRGAIVGAANPEDVTAERVVYVRDGNYSWDKLSAGTAYILNMSTSDLSKSLTLKGSCTGSGDQQDFSKQTVLRNGGSTNDLMAVSANAKSVIIEGFTFINTSKSGTGMDASTETDGSLTLKNCGFRISDTGLDITGNSGKMLIYNTLFADGGTGLSGADSQTTVVNATFANNDKDIDGTANVYNSVSWNNKTNNMPTTDGHNNKVFSFTGTAAANNVDIQNGPNFVDPLNETEENRDYHIRPSVQLLNQGSNDLYLNHVVKVVADADATAIPTTEVDLGNNPRLVDKTIDIGAYEYEAPLQPIVYVKPDLTGTADGKSWETALGDLQGAVDLAGLYALNNSGQNGYVFVHGNYHNTGSINLTLGNTKVYGGMNDERSSTTLGDSYTKDDVETIVSDLLTKRKGMLEASNRSSLGTVTISADGVIDGFEVTGTATVNNGMLSTSVVKNDVGGEDDGLLYNSLVLGSVNTVKAVNVTATGTITGANGSGNNRASVNETNSYVTDDYWKYQLMETSADIDPNPDDDPRTDISEYMKKVGHERDLIGNKRIRNTVDNGCFETWNISAEMTNDNVIKATDYPVSKSVVYVRKGQELKIQNANDGTLVYKDVASAFNPGFLLLEHQAGLRGNGNYISLTKFAVERDLGVNGNDLAIMPFSIIKHESKPNANYNLERYSGQTRAAYSYQYDSNNGKAWTDQDFALRGSTEGFLIENTSSNAITVRFSGNSYEENGTVKKVELAKWNFNEPWTSGTTGGQPLHPQGKHELEPLRFALPLCDELQRLAIRTGALRI
ncbi:right-handed parallel beta-helix repeat-containing protein [uncultured Bacteroides sp.]|uniref:choice-of-anchor Q domain-containing protein n=1 Tax=uncultured Bacteroides sp. TaxID=162156 RepID=UPI002617C244|nr:right-handed parallel beta-helix repeat-containing protein [uncultured Bacteroides sp.]